MMRVKRSTDRVIGGVLGGFSERYGWDPAIVRIAYTFLTMITWVFLGVVLYLVALIVMPEH